MSLDNPYLQALARNCTEDRDIETVLRDFTLRDRLTRQYAWAIPTEPVIQALRAYAPICDLGCGTGYWAYLLALDGTRVLAVDPAPPATGTNHWHPTHRFSDHAIRHHHDIVEGNAATFDVPPDHTLMLCWPPYNDPMAEIALLRYQGNTVIYIGEGPTGCTANDAFHKKLQVAWEQIEYHRIPQWAGIHDAVYVYKRTPRVST